MSANSKVIIPKRIVVGSAKFLCGCTTKPRKGFEIRYDAQNFLICPEHQVREEGWRTKNDIQRGILSNRPM